MSTFLPRSSKGILNLEVELVGKDLMFISVSQLEIFEVFKAGERHRSRCYMGIVFLMSPYKRPRI
jgi:hypothetical protein